MWGLWLFADTVHEINKPRRWHHILHGLAHPLHDWLQWQVYDYYLCNGKGFRNCYLESYDVLISTSWPTTHKNLGLSHPCQTPVRRCHSGPLHQEMVKRWAAQYVCNNNSWSVGVTSILNHLGWCSLQQRRVDIQLDMLYNSIVSMHGILALALSPHLIPFTRPSWHIHTFQLPLVTQLIHPV